MGSDHLFFRELLVYSYLVRFFARVDKAVKDIETGAESERQTEPSHRKYKCAM